MAYYRHDYVVFDYAEHIFDIGGDTTTVETAGKSYSLTNPDSQTLRFEIRPGDKA